MTGPLQIGDIIALARLAWNIYEYGFTDEHNASKPPHFASLSQSTIQPALSSSSVIYLTQLLTKLERTALMQWRIALVDDFEDIHERHSLTVSCSQAIHRIREGRERPGRQPRLPHKGRPQC